MFIERAKTLVEQESKKILETNPFFIKARTGLFQESDCINYLSNLMYLFQYTCPHLKVAQNRAAELGNQELADFFEKKIEEEKGHDQWAKQDLKNLNTIREQVDLSVINARPLICLLISVVL